MLARALLLLSVVAAAVPSAAYAHAKLQQSAPANGERVEVPPKALSLSFNEEVRLAVVTLTTDGKTVPVTVNRDAAPAKTVVVALPALQPGLYEVQWSAVSPADGHIMKGSLSFTIVGGSPLKH